MGGTMSLVLRRRSGSTKLKTLLGLTVSRIALLRNQRQARCAHAVSDVAHLLRLNHHDRALLRAEQVIKERNMLDAFTTIDGYCLLLIDRASLLEHINKCPDELLEAVSGLLFAAARCGDLPELLKIRRIFRSKLGNDFDYPSVDPKLMEMLSIEQPSLEIKFRVAKEIAAEKGIDLDDIEEEPVGVDSRAVGLMADQQYGDVVEAAQAAFEAAAYAAAAARAAVALSRAESWDT